MIEFSWELPQVLSGLKKNLITQQATKFLRPHTGIWGNSKDEFPVLAEEIMALLPTSEKKRQFLAVCLASYLLDSSKAPATVPSWIQQQMPVSDVIGIDITLENLMTWWWDRAAFPVLDEQGKNDTIYYALVASLPTNGHLLLPSWISEVMDADAQDAVTIAAELAHKSSPETSLLFWPLISPQKPTHDRSLGLPVYLSFLSVARRTSIPPIIATGEVTLQGRLAPVQGVQHKCDKAFEKRYHRFIYPEDGLRLERRREFTPVSISCLEEAEAEWGLGYPRTDKQDRDQQSSNAAPDEEKENTAYTQAYFDDIQLHILHSIRKAHISIHIAVAWFTDAEIFDLLCQKAQAGVRVELIIVDDAINRKSPIQHEKLTELGGLFLMVGNKKKSSAIMHNKFCVIDTNIVITGSYNWSKQAQENWENITITTGQSDLARQFLQEFNSIREHAAKKAAGATIDYAKVITRLEALRNVIELDDADDISLQLTKLKRLIPENQKEDEVRSIIELIESDCIDEAASLITSYVNTRKQIVVYTDPEIPELTLELKALELQVSALDNERAEVERILHTYHYRYNMELGDIVRKVLKRRAERLAKKAEENSEAQQQAEEAKQDYESFEQDFTESQQMELFTISKAEQDEMKALFRACSKMCHPDLVAIEFKHDAKDIFQKLNDANEKNDIGTIKAIYENLKEGLFAAMSETISDAQKLLQQVVRMRSKLKELAKSVYQLRSSDTWIKINEIRDLDAYFNETRNQLEEELRRLDTDE